MSRRQLPSLVLLVGLIAILCATLVYPVALTIEGGFRGPGGGFTFHHVIAIFRDAPLRAGLLNAFAIALATTAASIAIGLPLAVLTARFDFPGKGLLGAFVLVPLILPPFVGAIGLQHLLGRAGSLNAILIAIGVTDTGFDFIGRGGFWAIVAVEALHLYPILYLNATAALANLDPALDEAAENLGAGAWRRFLGVTLPLIRPGLFAGATIVFIWSFTELGTPLMFDYQVVTPVQIFNGLKEMESSHQPYALTAVMLLIAVALYLVGKVAFGKRAYEMYAKASVRATTKALHGWGALAGTAAFASVSLVAVMPHIGVVLASLARNGFWYATVLPTEMTLDNYEAALAHPLAVGSISTSLFLASCAVGLDLVLGILIGYVLVRTRVPGRQILDALSMLPLAVPGLVMAFGFVAVSLRWPFRENDPLAGFVDVLGADPNPIPLLIVAYAVRRLPYVVRSTVAGLEQTARELEEAALNLGASRLRTMRTVLLPLIAANLLAGGLLAFSFAMLEVSDSIILAQREAHFPITKAILVLFYRLGDGPSIASALGVWSMALLALGLLGASRLIGKKMGALFRV